MAKPFTQLGGGRQPFQPVIDASILLGYTSGPDAIHQHPAPITAGGGVVGAFQANVHQYFPHPENSNPSLRPKLQGFKERTQGAANPQTIFTAQGAGTKLIVQHLLASGWLHRKPANSPFSQTPAHTHHLFSTLQRTMPG